MRQIILDTETTGLRVEEGHRIIEIGCIEMIDRKVTQRHFHYYLNPGREIEAGAMAVHGITNEFLKDKPSFKDIAEDFLQFIAEDELIIHNAPFDLSFLNQELKLSGCLNGALTDQCSVIDTLVLARKMHAGQRNSLDALCKRYGVNNTKRELHGALLDANLLALVYLAMTGGQSSFFEALQEGQSSKEKREQAERVATEEHYSLIIQKADDGELCAHEDYLRAMKQHGKCLWLED